MEAAIRHPVVRATLEECGWSRSYRFEPAKWVAQLRVEGFSVHSQGIAAMTLLGGLTIIPPKSIDAVFGTGEFKVDPFWAATGESPRIIEREKLVGEELCPIGEWLGEYIVLVGSSGKFYAETSFRLLELGAEINEALVRIIVASSEPKDIAR